MSDSKRISRHRPDSAELSRWFRRAIACEEGALQELLTLYRPLLLAMAHSRLDAPLRLKAAPSDLVQNTLWSATRTFTPKNFACRGKFLAWLITILEHEVAAARRRFLLAQKRDIRREQSLQDPQANGMLHELSASLSASQAGFEQSTKYAGLLEAAIARLPSHYQLVLRLRYAEKQNFTTIAKTLERSYDGARMLCQRALQQVKDELEILESDAGGNNGC